MTTEMVRLCVAFESEKCGLFALWSPLYQSFSYSTKLVLAQYSEKYDMKVHKPMLNPSAYNHKCDIERRPSPILILLCWFYSRLRFP